MLGVVAATAPLRTTDTLITADAGYHSEANLRALAEAHVSALIADRNRRKRDTRFATQERYMTLPNPLHDTSRPMKKTVVVFGPDDFRYDPVARTGIWPAGKSLNRRGATNVTGGHAGEHFQGAPRDCRPCPLRTQCLRTLGTTPVRNVAFFRDRIGRDVNDPALMRERIDAPAGRAQYARRFATVEPVFANLRANNGYAA